MNQIARRHLINFMLEGPFKTRFKKMSNQCLMTRALWILTYITSFSLFSYYTFGIFTKWWITPDISINIRNIPSHNIPFPAVTFCTPYVLPERLLNYTDFLSRYYFEKKPRKYSSKQLDLLEILLKICNPNFVLKQYVKLNKRNGKYLLRALNESRYSELNVYQFCAVESTVFDCDRMFNVVPTSNGLCYSFNMQGYNTIFNKGILGDDFNFFKRKTITKSLDAKNLKLYYQNVDDEKEFKQWTLDDGYLTDHVDIIPYRASKRWINIYLGFKHVDFHFCPGRVFQFNLHLPNEIPFVNNVRFYPNMSAYTQVFLEAKSIKRSKNLKKYSPEIRQCFFSDEKKLKYFKSYTKAHCDTECLTNYTLKFCGCVKFYMPRSSNERVCDFDEYPCTNAAWQNIYLYRKNIDNYSVPCNCLPPCNEIKYKVKEINFKSVSIADPVIANMKRDK